MLLNQGCSIYQRLKKVLNIMERVLTELSAVTESWSIIDTVIRVFISQRIISAVYKLDTVLEERRFFAEDRCTSVRRGTS